ncbi:L-lactate permease [Rhodobacteraceae bacterium CCMM004]|nr:L-lactate permease [Rhodobacteraceae bacterium CCMM004]
MMGLAAAVPLALALAAMAVLRVSAAAAGAVGLAAALILAVTLFAPDTGTGAMLAGAGAEAVHTTATILWIVLAALALYEFQNRAGAIGRIRDALSGMTADRRVQAILIAWFFGLFMEGAAGFGTPVALAAPLLAGLGYDPARAVVLALLGHAAGVSFGAVGTPTLAQLDLSDLSPTALAGSSAALHAVVSPLLLLATVRLAGDGPLSRSDLGWTALAWICFAVPSVAIAALAGPELPSLAGALAGLAVFVLVLRARTGARLPPLGPLGRDLVPYALILAAILATRLIAPLGEALSSAALSWSLWETYGGSFAPLYHPGTLLMAGVVIGALVTGRGALLAPAIGAALGRLWPVALALLAMLSLSRLMVHSGQIATLAEAAAGAGAVWPLLAPLIGVLGTFVTGSATASNILFTELQIEIAATLSLPPTLMAAAQSFGSAVGNVVAPHNIIAGCATVGLVGREGDILARTLGTCALALAAGGALIALAAWLA